jgi:DNA polymerase III alpha subunit
VPNDVLYKYQSRIETERLDYPLPKNNINSQNWFIPEKYKNFDIEQFLISQCPAENYDRLEVELELFKKHNMIMVLKAMKYLVDSMRSNQIMWGVGRGSSVASYALFLIGVHKIDSVKYNLPIEEFFKGE